MRIVRQVGLEEVLEVFNAQNPAGPHHASRDWALENLRRASQQHGGDWMQVMDMWDVMTIEWPTGKVHVVQDEDGDRKITPKYINPYFPPWVE